MIESIGSHNMQDILLNVAKLDEGVSLKILGRCCIGLDFYRCVCGKLNDFKLLPDVHERDTESVQAAGLMRFDNLDCLSVIKRSMYTSLSREQIHNELLAYEREYGKENKTLILLALGGDDLPFEIVHDTKPVLNAMVFYCSWHKFRAVIEDVRRNVRVSAYRDQLILDDILSSLEHSRVHVGREL